MIDPCSRIKFIETCGRKFIDQLKVRDPLQSNCKTEENTFICSNRPGAKPICKVANVGYALICSTCRERKIEKVYIGETCRNAHLRGNEHMKLLEKESEKSVLYKHIVNEHKGEKKQVKFEMQVTGRFKAAINRQIDEGVRIQSRKPSALLNSKSEFYGPAVKRKVLEGS